MKKKTRPSHGILGQNVFFFRLFLFYLILLLVLAGVACFFSYRQKTAELNSQSNMILSGLDREYRDITSSFWKIYMPLFEARSTTFEPVQAYFSGQTLTRALRSDLEYAMTQMILRDDRVDWMVLYSPQSDTSCLLLSDSRQIQMISLDFPDLSRMTGRRMKILGIEALPGIPLKNETFAMACSVPTTMGEGCIIAGYRTTVFRQICAGYDSMLDSMCYEIVSDGDLVFSSAGRRAPLINVQASCEGVFSDPEGGKRYVKASPCGDRDSFLIYSVLEQEMNRYVYRLTLQILLLVLLFAIISFLLYLLTLRVITREVNAIRQGLLRISNNDMATPIQGKFIQTGLKSIAQAVNDMAQRLNRTINRAHYYQLRQKEAELSDLQSKYNPHFLYNTLEMLRNRCEQAGVSDVAELITDFSAIFRSLIGSKTFVPLEEELLSTRRYLSLLGARYKDQVEVRYDFTRDVLRYGIIRNVFQPLIENYFQYGFDTATDENEIIISGKLLENGLMELSVKDNGRGMSPESIEALRIKLTAPAQDSKESYGLKNLQQRLKLFYGDECGLRIESGQEGGLSVTIIARTMTSEEYESSQSSLPTLMEEDFHETRYKELT